MADTDLPKDVAKLSFEDALEELKQIVAKLEGGQGKLDQAIEAYQRGAALKRHCEAKLREAQEKIEKISLGPKGEVETEPFDSREVPGVADLKRALEAVAAQVEQQLDALLPAVPGARGRVVEAMRYSALGGGKRLRPFLVVQSARLFDVPEDQALRAAAAVEMVHCYSLIHDDLPAMDDSDLRRGRATNHMAFDEATAILAGDGLLTEAFAVLADPSTHADPAVRAELVAGLAAAAGAAGMVGGQMIDISPARARLDLAGITALQSLKTGALITLACDAGAILGAAPEAERGALRAFAGDLGLAFQIADDLLDAEGSAEELGKPTGQDSAQGKATFVGLLGAEGARAKAVALINHACTRLDLFGEKADLLLETAQFVVQRRN